jgi:DNA-binding transcriptional ArsR family regulator
MPDPAEHDDPRRPLGFDEAEALAESIRAFGTASRLRLLWAMLDGEQTVEQLAERAELSQSAASHQLRLLRQGRLVAVRRQGRNAWYRLYDHHMTDLLAALRHHHEHVNPPAPAAALPSGPTATRERDV